MTFTSLGSNLGAVLMAVRQYDISFPNHQDLEVELTHVDCLAKGLTVVGWGACRVKWKSSAKSRVRKSGWSLSRLDFSSCVSSRVGSPLSYRNLRRGTLTLTIS